VLAQTLFTNELSGDDRHAWQTLVGRAAEPNPFFGPAFVQASADSWGEPAELLVIRDGTSWLACLPLTRAGRWRRLKPFAHAERWLPEYTYFATPLVDRDALRPAAAALAHALVRDERAALVVLDPLDADGSVGPDLVAALEAQGSRPIVYEEFKRAAVRRRPEPTYLDTVSAKRRKELRRLKRRLEREVGAGLAVEDLSGQPEACEAFLEMELSSWKGDNDTALASRPEDAAFFRALCGQPMGEGGLQILALQGGGRTVAMQCNLIQSGVMFGFKVAYERELARFSPGVLLEVDALEVFHERISVDFIDSCAAPDSEPLAWLWPDLRALRTVVVPTRSLLAPAVRAAVLIQRVATRTARKRRSSSAAR
jgi:CelD/BcsL family acetyltransferase involved in cellulose biosynthesis